MAVLVRTMQARCYYYLRESFLRAKLEIDERAQRLEPSDGTQLKKSASCLVAGGGPGIPREVEKPENEVYGGISLQIPVLS
jgi:hypothetical protein